MKLTVKLLNIIIFCAAIPLFASTGPDGELTKKTRYLMDTYCSVLAPVKGDKKIEAALDVALDRVEELDKKFSAFRPGGPVYEFNKHAIPITDPETLELVKRCLDINEKSGGAFDITVTPLVKLWGFYGEIPKNPKIPGKEEILAAMKQIGPGSIELKDGKLVKLRSSAEIDLGAGAKAYAVGEAMKSLKKSGVKSAMVDLGGDLYAIGLYNGKPWKAGIKNPRGEGALGVLGMTELSMSTSGDYERYYEIAGRRYCHIIDPMKGVPASELMTVAIITPDATMANLLSTSVFVLGRDKGLKLIEKYPGTEAIIISAKGEITLTDGLKKLFSLKEKGGKK